MGEYDGLAVATMVLAVAPIACMLIWLERHRRGRQQGPSFCPRCGQRLPE